MYSYSRQIYQSLPPAARLRCAMFVKETMRRPLAVTRNFSNFPRHFETSLNRRYPGSNATSRLVIPRRHYGGNSNLQRLQNLEREANANPNDVGRQLVYLRELNHVRPSEVVKRCESNKFVMDPAINQVRVVLYSNN